MMGKDITTYDARFAAEAERLASAEKTTGGTFISTRGGVLKLGDDEFPGNRIACVIIDVLQENTFYTGKYNEENPLPPVCYAAERMGDEVDMGPHVSMQAHLDYFEPQHETCEGCPMLRWGTADTGKGKACQERRRLTILPAGFYEKKRGSRDFELELIDDPKVILEDVEPAMIRLPVTSVRAWSEFVKKLSATMQRPPWGVITEISSVQDSKTQFKLTFDVLGTIDDPDFLDAVYARRDMALQDEYAGFNPPDAEREEQEEPSQGKAGLTGLRKGSR